MQIEDLNVKVNHVQTNNNRLFFLVLHVGSDWKEFFYGALVPWYHYIPITDANRVSGGGSQSKIIEDLLTFLKHDDKNLGDKNGHLIAQKIASNGRKFIEEHLTMQNIELYWYDLLSQYSKLLDFKPSLNTQFIRIKA